MATAKSNGAPGSAAIIVGIVAGVIISTGGTMAAAMGMLKAKLPEFLDTHQLLAGGAGLGLIAGLMLARRATTPLKGAIFSAIAFAVAAAVVVVPLAVISYNQTAAYASIKYANIDNTMAYNTKSAASCIVALAVGGLLTGLLVPMIMQAFRKPASELPA